MNLNGSASRVGSPGQSRIRVPVWVSRVSPSAIAVQRRA